MQFLAFLAPIAFIFALSAIAKIEALQKEVRQLKSELDELKK
ncbi:MAG: hypothetical protein SCK29_03785 [Bacillota bacterium]|nr:hypothetical protein [Bacillota bacterium]MDW7683227.1 hypothetical protein [Bacillota bacterium]